MHLEVLLDLAIALGVGLLIGSERGWRAREEKNSHDLVAGIRTFGLAGLLGGLVTLLDARIPGAWICLFLLFGILVIVTYYLDAQYSDDRGMTTEIAMLLTVVLGSLSLENHLLAASCAIIVTLLLNLKEWLHTILRQLSEIELRAALKLLFISIVLLPSLPNQGYGPWALFNPYQIWWMVVLIAGIGFAAYIAIRLLGTRHGLLVTALLGGFISSTAMTITLSRLYQPRLTRSLAAGLLATSALMFPRVLVEVGAINPDLLKELLWPMVVSGLIYAAGAGWFLYLDAAQPDADTEPPLRNPFELGPALRLAGLLVIILYLVKAGDYLLGEQGIYLVALLSGLTDVDAITLTLAHQATNDLESQVATLGIFIAAFSNCLVKGGLIAVIGGHRLALHTLPIMAAGLAAGLATLLWL